MRLSLFLLLFALAVGTDASAKQPVVGSCELVTVAKVGSRTVGAPKSGSAIGYPSGKYQVSYALVPGIGHSRIGDRVKLCVTAAPTPCPPGDVRGVVYQATNLRTAETWTEADSEHECGGA